MSAYYNEHDRDKAEVLRELMRAGVIAPGDVDERSIKDVRAGDLLGYTQCHFFAGIGVWSYAARCAGWPDDRPMWSGSCPCQSFSNAGKRRGRNDPRHLWPEWIRLIREVRPPVIFGEQVGAAAGGKTYSPQDMQALRDREAVRRVLYELERTAPRRMQILHAGSRETPQSGPEAGAGPAACGLEAEAPGAGAGECRSLSREKERPDVHAGFGKHSGAHRPWTLRGDRHTVRPDETAIMERSLFGPDFDGGGLHDGEHPGSALLFECDGQRLGHPDGRGCGERDQRAAYRAERRTARILERCFEETPEWSWLDSVFADLERAGYACGSPVFGAHSVSAPHIRQRLYFVADDAAERCGEEYAHTGGEPARDGAQGGSARPVHGRHVGELADTASCGRVGGWAGEASGESGSLQQLERPRDAGSVGHSSGKGFQGFGGHGDDGNESGRFGADAAGSIAPAGCIGGMDDANGAGRREGRRGDGEHVGLDHCPAGEAGALADASGGRRDGWPPMSGRGPEQRDASARPSQDALLAHHHHDGRPSMWRVGADGSERHPKPRRAVGGFWADAEWIPCRDPKVPGGIEWRAIESGTFPLAHGAAARVLALRCFGDAIVAPLAEEFIRAYCEARGLDSL